MGQVLVSGLVTGAIYGILAIGLVMVYRGSKVLNFAHVEIGTFALYAAWWVVVEQGLPWIVGALAAIVVAAALSAAFERLVVARMVDAPRLSVAVATIGLMLLLLALELRIWGAGPRFLRGPVTGQGPEIAGYFVSTTEMLAFAIALAVGLGLNAFLRRTDFGLGVLASAQDPTAVRMMGISLTRVSLFTWVTSGVLAAVAVLLVEPTVGAFAPGIFSVSVNALFIPALAAALLAGLTSLSRAFYGGLAIGVLDASIRRIFLDASVPGLSSVAIFAVIVGALLVLAPRLSMRGAT